MFQVILSEDTARPEVWTLSDEIVDKTNSVADDQTLTEASVNRCWLL